MAILINSRAPWFWIHSRYIYRRRRRTAVHPWLGVERMSPAALTHPPCTIAGLLGQERGIARPYPRSSPADVLSAYCGFG